MSGHVPRILDGLGKETIFRELYENSPDLYRTIDLQGKIILCNKAYAISLGYTIDEIKNHSIYDHVSKNSIKILKNTFEKWKDTGKVSNIELWFKRKDSTEFPVLLSVNSIYDVSGKVIGSNTVIRDLSDMYSAKDEINFLKIQRFSVLGQLSARIAHDVRNPLSIISNAVQILTMQNNPELEKHSSLFKKMEKAISRITHQVDDVLDYVRPRPLNLGLHSLSDILCHTVESIKESRDVVINIPKNDVKLQCDAAKLEILFVNLVLNAIQSMNSKGMINLRITEQTSSVIMSIEDDGPGIPDELKTKIFEPLFTTKQSGTGLGLASCKTIVDSHHGTISLTSTLGKGTTFSIEIPKNLVELVND